jgi:hypothetical protein
LTDQPPDAQPRVTLVCVTTSEPGNMVVRCPRCQRHFHQRVFDAHRCHPMIPMPHDVADDAIIVTG